MSNTPKPEPKSRTSLVIWQLNANKSDIAQHAFSHNPLVLQGTILAFKEPYLDYEGDTHCPPSWIAVYPTTHRQKDKARTRAAFTINPVLSTKGWEQVDCDCPDLVAVRVGSDKGAVTIINVYNPCDSNSTLLYVDRILKEIPQGEHSIVLGDFNRHHPAWDEDRNAHLFTSKNLELVRELLDLTGGHWLEMALPKDIPMLESTRTKNHTHPDNVFVSYSLALGLVSCNTAPDRRPTCTDHYPIHTDISLEPARVPLVDRWNFKKMDETVFRKVLKERLENLSANQYPGGQEGLDARVRDLSEAILKAVEHSVPRLRLDPRLRRWWTPELTAFRREVRKLAGLAYKLRFSTLDPAHTTYRAARNRYTQVIRDAKRKHWEDYLESLDDETLWSAASYIGDGQGGRGRTRVPNLKYRGNTGTDKVARDNEMKSRVLLDSFFPLPAPHNDTPDPRAPPPVQDLPDLTVSDVLDAIRNLKPHKATGPDGLPACVYIAGAELLAPRLLEVFNLSLKKGIYPTAWHHSHTAILQKPGKPELL